MLSFCLFVSEKIMIIGLYNIIFFKYSDNSVIINKNQIHYTV